MKVVILCGGLGSRLSEETKIKPKPMVKIGNKPILIHILEIYKKFGFDEFILATGYKHEYILNYFQNNKKYNLKVVFTGKKSLTGRRLLKLKKFFKPNENFMLTYGDGLSDQNLEKLLQFHIKQNKIATVTAVRPPLRFGELDIKKNLVKKFEEKPQSKKGWINGGFFVFNYKIFNFIKKKQNVMLEREPIKLLVKSNNLACYKHSGFWQCMDNMREKKLLENLLEKKYKAPWI